MSNEAVIRAMGLGKKYIIGHQAADRQATLRDSISHSLANFARTTRDMLRGKPIIAGDEIEEFWALKEVNFEIDRGDVVGIIGRNGAGKSTLLKILSRITEPSEGRVEIRGRVASLLEVGTGFHPELTGRENIFLNGAILGMTRSEIRRKFDEIVAFSGVEKFLDTPVKRYSSGMYVRLAFSIASHLEPEILIVDEVLAVGDTTFQRMCIERMAKIAESGTTVIFVSHSMDSVRSLCKNGIWLNGGEIRETGTIDHVISRYLDAAGSSSSASECETSSSPVVIEKRSAALRNEVDGKQTVVFSLLIDSDKHRNGVVIKIGLRDQNDRPVAQLSTFLSNGHIELQAGVNEVRCSLPEPPLFPAMYGVHISVSDHDQQLVTLLHALKLDLTGIKHFKQGRLPDYGPAVLQQSWDVR